MTRTIIAPSHFHTITFHSMTANPATTPRTRERINYYLTRILNAKCKFIYTQSYDIIMRRKLSKYFNKHKMFTKFGTSLFS